MCLLTLVPPRQWKPIKWQSWNNRFQHFQTQPFKRSVQNNEFSICSLWCLRDYGFAYQSINGQVQTVSTFACLNYCISSLWLYAAIYKEQLIGLENKWKLKLRTNVTQQYLRPECVVYSCWVSERNRFSENCVMNFTVMTTESCA